MLVIALTSIPPRFSQLDRVLAGLLAQGGDAVALALPRRFPRFAQAPRPDLPAGVQLIETEDDLGPAGKLLAPARAFPEADILYCDDDWLYAPGWAEAFLDARAAHGRDTVIAGSTWATERIGRGGGTVVQGFAGVLVAAEHAARIPDPPEPVWSVDDIWLSGHFAAFGLPVVTAERARAHMSPLASPGALQDTTPRDPANRAAAALIHELYGIWPHQ